MEIIYADLFKYMGKNYLSVRDQVSSYTFMFDMKHTDTKEIMEKLRHLMIEYRVAKKIVTDGAANLNSGEFNNFCAKRKIAHQVSSPYSPSSNAYSEVGVHRCKFSLRRSTLTGIPAQHLLKQNQEMILSDCLASPKSLFLKIRVTRGTPTREGLQKPFIWEKEIKMREKHQMERAIPDQKKRYIGGFGSAERVRIQETAAKGKQWKHIGTIREQTP